MKRWLKILKLSEFHKTEWVSILIFIPVVMIAFGFEIIEDFTHFSNGLLLGVSVMMEVMFLTLLIRNIVRNLKRAKNLKVNI